MKKFDKRYIFYHLVFDFFAILFFTFVFFMENIVEESTSKDELGKLILVFSILFIVVYALKTLYSVLYVNTSGYELKNSEIVCKRGVLFKKRSILEYTKIHAVNKKQNIIQKLFKLAVLTLDSGSTNKSHIAEIVVHEREDVVDELVRKIKLKQENPDAIIDSQETPSTKEEKENLYKFTSKTKFIYSLISVVATLFVTLFVLICVLVVFGILYLTVKDNINGTLAMAIVITLYVCIGITLLSFIISIIYMFVGYYDFKIYKNERDIEINYGLIVKNSNTFKLNRIKGVTISQGLIQRLFKYVTVKLEVIGYVEQSGENQNQITGILFPLCKESELEANLSNVLPSYVPVKKERKAVKYFPFISWNFFFVTLFTVLAIVVGVLNLVVLKVQAKYCLVVIIGALIVLGVILSIIAINNCFAYNNNGITIKGDTIYIYNGGFTRRCTVIKTKNLIAIEDITTPLRERNGIYTFDIHYHTNTLSNVVRLHLVDKSLITELRDLLDY